jgi:hypothetical protein
MIGGALGVYVGVATYSEEPDEQLVENLLLGGLRYLW